MHVTQDPIAPDGFRAYAKKLRSGEISAEQATRAYLDRIEQIDPHIGAFEHVAYDSAIATARAVDAQLAAGEDIGPLMGVPVAIKDNFFVNGMPTGAGTRVDIRDLDAPEGTFVQTLRRAGCIVLGKTKTVEFALGITGASAPRGMPRNPCDPGIPRVPGGSSSGSAAAVAAGLCGFSIGTDTGGSVRVPAALCGQAGLKTSAGCWPMDGIVPLSPELDTVGVIAACVSDIALIHTTLKGEGLPVASGLSRLRVGRPSTYFYRNLDNEVATRTAKALAQLERAGVHVAEIDVPEASAREAYFPVMLPARLIEVLGRERFLAQRDLMDPMVAARCDSGLFVTRADMEGCETRRLLDAARIGERFRGIDAWITPTATVVPPATAELADPQRNWTLTMGMTQNSQPVNYLGLCAITVPLPDTGALPVGIQIVAPHGKERRAVAIALAIEACVGRAPRYDMSKFLQR